MTIGLGFTHLNDDDFLTAFGNRLFTKTVNLLHGGAYTDAMVIFRAYRKQLIFDLELANVEQGHVNTRS